MLLAPLRAHGGPRQEPRPRGRSPPPQPVPAVWAGERTGRAGHFSGSEVPEPPSKCVTWGAGGHAPVPSCRPQGLLPVAIAISGTPQQHAGVSRCRCSGSCSAPRSSSKGAALGHRGGREGARGQPPSAAPAGRVGTGNKDRETHGPGLPQEVCGAGPKRARADKGGPRRPPSSPPHPRPPPGVPAEARRPTPPQPTQPSPVTAGSGKNSRSFLNSRCRLHGRPYGLTQGFTN